MPLREQTVLVLGLGDTGLSMVRWLRGAGATVRVADSRAEPPHLAAMHAEFADIRCDCGPFQASSFDGIDLIALSPGVPLAEPLVQDAVRRGVQVTGDVELFARALNKYFPRVRTIAITGSNGKSTVTSMVGAMCSKAGFNTVVAGNIGLPVLDALGQVLSSGATPDIFVLELSSFTPLTTTPCSRVVSTRSERTLTTRARTTRSDRAAISGTRISSNEVACAPTLVSVTAPTTNAAPIRRRQDSVHSFVFNTGPLSLRGPAID